MKSAKEVNPATPSRRHFLKTSMVGGVSAAMLPALAGAREFVPAPATTQNEIPSFELDEITISDLQSGMASGKYTARSSAEKYLARIDQIDKHGPMVNSVIEVNPDALSIADQLDQERKQKGPRGPLHGIPILIKDNIDTGDRMMTTAGSLALAGPPAPKDSFVAQRLRESGAVILGKTNLSEWANIRSGHSTSGWSGRGGLTRNAYCLDRNACGSSSGSGVAASANLCAAAIGTETDGSVVCPSSINGLVGIKPTVGLVSRSGIVPISHSQDTAGPMARSVRDAAILLSALTGVDPRDKATAASAGKAQKDYTQFLEAGGLRGARIGVGRKYFGFSDAVDRLMNSLIEEMKKEGTIIIDPADLPSFGKFNRSEFTVLQYELKADLNAYLATRPNAPVHSLQEIIQFNEQNRDKEMPWFGQDIFLKSQEKGPLTEKEYVEALANDHQMARGEGIDAVMDKFNLDAIMAPTAGPAWLIDLINGDHDSGGSSSAAAVAGYPDITVPAGFLFGLPVGVSFFGRAWSEPKLLKIAYGFEQMSKARQAPKFVPSLELRATGPA